MTGVAVAVLSLAAAVILMSGQGPKRSAPTARPSQPAQPGHLGHPAGHSVHPGHSMGQGRRDGRARSGRLSAALPGRGVLSRAARNGQDDLADQARVLRQMSALLAAGRPINTVWTDLLTAREPPPRTADRRARRDDAVELDLDAGDGAVTTMLRAAARAARWGHDATAVLRAASPVHARADPAVVAALAAGWCGLADCIDIARTTGAPLADLLDRFATAQDDARDAEAARTAALAGPATTVRILRWLPLAGLGLGILMGADPLGVLLTTPAGLVLTAAAVLLMGLGHVWVKRMIRAAAA